MSVDNRDFMRFQAGQWLGNAIAGGVVNFTSGAGQLATGLFGGFQLKAFGTGHTAAVTWLNTAGVVPHLAWAPLVDETLLTVLGGQAGHKFLRIASVASTAATIGLYNGTDTALGTIHVAVLGMVRSDRFTGVTS